MRSGFLDTKKGDVVKVQDIYSHDADVYFIKVEEIEKDKEYATGTNPEGIRFFGECLNSSGDDYLTVVDEENFLTAYEPKEIGSGVDIKYTVNPLFEAAKNSVLLANTHLRKDAMEEWKFADFPVIDGEGVFYQPFGGEEQLFGEPIPFTIRRNDIESFYGKPMDFKDIDADKVIEDMDSAENYIENIYLSGSLEEVLEDILEDRE